MAKILNGNIISKQIIQECANKVRLLNKNGKSVKLAVVGVGQNKSFDSYLKGIQSKAKLCQIKYDYIRLDTCISQEKLLKKINELNTDVSVNGILVLRPFPNVSYINENLICETIDKKKDVDCANTANIVGSFLNKDTFNPCTAEACLKILDFYNIDIESKNIVVIGRSFVVGKPLANMLLNKNATVTICHSYTKNLSSITKCADIVISAIGKANILDSTYFSSGQVVIDCGIN